MGETKGDTKQQPPPSQPPPSSPSTETSEKRTPVVVSGAPFIPSPVFVPIGATSPFDQQFEQVNPKRQRYNTSSHHHHQWKLLPSPASQKQMGVFTSDQSSPSPTTNPKTTPHNPTTSSSDTASSPPHSPIPSLSAASGQETSKTEGQDQQFVQPQFRKGKYVSPVWKPNEMLWLARAWRVQYQGGSGSRTEQQHHQQHQSLELVPVSDVSTTQSTRGKTRAEKDREVAEFLQRHGVNRDAKTAGTKWDNMLGEFRKVYEWERGSERDQIGKSYFRLSPYERKLHRLPASFDEEVFEELSQFMGSRIRSSNQTRASVIVSGEGPGNIRPLPPPSFKEDELSLSSRTAKQMVMGTGVGGSGLLGFETLLDVALPSSSTTTSSKELRRIGKVKMTWEESVSLWGEEGDQHRGRVRVQGCSFLNADELLFFDDAMVICNMESFEEGTLRGFSVDRFIPGQQVKVLGRRKPSSSSATASSGFIERVPLPFSEPSIRSIPPWEFQDPTDYYVGCLRVPPTTLPSLFELSWHVQEPPPEELRFPLRRDVYRDLPQGKELFFTTSTELLDSRAITYDILSSIIRANTNPTLPISRDSFIGLWDDCINRVVSKFCSLELLLIRKPSPTPIDPTQDQWPNITGFVRNFCLWRGEECDQLREGYIDPSSSIVEKLLWSYMDLPYLLGYYAVGYIVTFCALSRSQDRVIRTDLYSLDLSSPTERLKALIPCYRIAGLLPLLADRCFNNINNTKLFSDFERIDLGNGNFIETSPTTVTKFFSSKRKWSSVKEIYDFLDHRIPHAESIYRASDLDLTLVFKPRGYKSKPTSCDQLVEALKYVTKALVALHDLSFMHRDLTWEKVMRRSDRESEWFVSGFEEAVGAPQIYPHGVEGGGRHAPEMGRGLHGVKVDVWGVGQLVKTCGLSNVPKLLRELQNRCLEQNPEQRPTAADCYHHLLQLQSSTAPY